VTTKVAATRANDARSIGFSNSVYETQANQLAADILMPIRLVKKWRPMIPNAKDLPKKFGVSEQAMSIRLKGLSDSAPSQVGKSEGF
jgi:Zn-dependent peptidase ImmA (M78 family)